MSPTERTGELLAVMERLADWHDRPRFCGEGCPGVPHDPGCSVAEGPDHKDDVATLLGLTTVLLEEHQATVHEVNLLLEAMEQAADKVTASTKLVVANAGSMKKYITGA